MSVLAEQLEKATAIGLGPGLGQSDALTEFVGELYRTVKQPMVVDADALNALGQATGESCPRAGGPRVLTPHPGEFGRLIGRDKIPTDERESLAREFASRTACVVVLKGHHTVITDGTQLALNTTGNPGMATGGTGDVLTGIITALLCQQLSPYDAARLGCHVHGLAGDLAADELGEVSLIASDLMKYLPMAWQLTQGRRKLSHGSSPRSPHRQRTTGDVAETANENADVCDVGATCHDHVPAPLRIPGRLAAVLRRFGERGHSHHQDLRVPRRSGGVRDALLASGDEGFEARYFERPYHSLLHAVTGLIFMVLGPIQFLPWFAIAGFASIAGRAASG